jgi:eukaryotic-like serine/threonine-protein kinase
MKLCPTCKTRYPDDANFCPQESCATPDGPQRLQALVEEAKPRFQLLARIGGSSTGEVWKARDGESGNEVAYKLVATEVLPTPAAQARAEREFKQLQRVQSPRIAAVIDCGKAADERLFVATELWPGESLDKLLKSGPMPLDRAKALVAQIGQALLEAQKAGIVHRDVAPKNVLVTSSGDVKVINFPLAKPLTDKVAGVPAYVSPEQAQGKPVDQRSNTYSLACIFYHLLTGEPPFQAQRPQQVLDLHVSSPPLPPSQRRPEANLSPEVDRVVLKALDKNSSRRHLTLRLFLTEIESLSPLAGMGAGGPASPGAGVPTGTPGVGFAKTMLFAGGQSEVANLVAKAIASRSGSTPPSGAPSTAPGAAGSGGLPATAPLPAAAAAAPASTPSGSHHPLGSAVANTVVAGPGRSEASVPAVSRLTPPPVTPHPPQAAGAAPVVGGAPLPAATVAAIAAAKAAVAEGKAAPGEGSGKGSAFRETLWFKKGDVDQMVAEAKAKMAGKMTPGEGSEALPEDVRPIEDRYVDDGTVTTEDRKKFSLRTGGTATQLPAVGASLPGEKMSEHEVIDEIAGSRRTKILVVSAVVAVALIAVLVAMLGGGKKERRTEGAAPAAPAAAAAQAPKPAPPAPAATPPATAAAAAKAAPPPAGGAPPPAAAARPAREHTAVAKREDPPAAKKPRPAAARKKTDKAKKGR